ncbi:MAG: aminoglycoside adenylyltransferase domain-containing protein [Nocardioides sp.]
MNDLPELEAQLAPGEADLLRTTLAALDAGVREAVGDVVGVYLKGSFALGAGDFHADVDFLVVTSEPLSDSAQADVRSLHRSLPDRVEHWAHNLEGSYVSLPSLAARASDEPWLYVNNGSREMEWSTHDNTEVFRWVLRNRGLTISGRSATSLIGDVPLVALRSEVARLAQSRAREAFEDPDYLANAWGQPHEVLSSCRLLYTASTGAVAGKADAARWCLSVVPDRFGALIEAAIASRPDPWERVHRQGDPASVAPTREFIEAMVPLVVAAAARPVVPPVVGS